MREQLQLLGRSLLRLGPRRLIALAVVGLSVVGVTGLVGYYLSRPDLETLYVGLDRMDVSRIGSALKDAGIPFDVNAEGTSVFVPFGQTARARVLLAEKGLPQSAKSGYELFDRIGALGITSFMQQVTRVRAVEGELARTIQAIQGVKAARVHIVMQDEGSFRRARQPPSASIVIRTEGVDAMRTAQAVRHLVAAAVPEMTPARVTVLGADGALLASGNDGDDGAPGGKLLLERSLAQTLEENVRKTLAPYLSLRNFQISVVARANMDRRQVSETLFNPDQRVERSVRVTRENQVAENANARAPTTVTSNLPPTGSTPPADRRTSNEALQKREELTNYEISSKVITTSVVGFALEGLSVALLVNRAALLDAAGKPLADEPLKARLTEIEALASAAVGLDRKRGDRLDLAAVDFAGRGDDLQPLPQESIRDALLKQAGTVVKSIAALAIAGLLIGGGLRPALRLLLATPPAEAVAMRDAPAAPALRAGAPMTAPALPATAAPALLDAPGEKPTDRLRRLVEADSERALSVMRQWIAEGRTG